uniref:Uncharacterized protein LOC100181297 n=1 Tax=Phallusia mammillata TaxID=59560 RepID=A0A6F9DIB6_9ASCI|nr:uncharacterized protein LOC100181297 [Phallusia mammillata]
MRSDCFCDHAPGIFSFHVNLFSHFVDHDHVNFFGPYHFYDHVLVNAFCLIHGSDGDQIDDHLSDHDHVIFLFFHEMIYHEMICLCWMCFQLLQKS